MTPARWMDAVPPAEFAAIAVALKQGPRRYDDQFARIDNAAARFLRAVEDEELPDE